MNIDCSQYSTDDVTSTHGHVYIEILVKIDSDMDEQIESIDLAAR